jgi:hypothetical protein
MGGINIIIGKSDTHTFSVEGYPPEYHDIVKDYYGDLYKIKLGYEEK